MPKQIPEWLKVWLIPGALAVGWHAVWYVGLTPARPTATAERPEAPALALGPGTVVGPAEADAYLTWSPDLFSLPSPAGFSGALRWERRAVRPPLTAPHTSAFFVARSPSVPAVRALPREGLEDQVRRRFEESEVCARDRKAFGQRARPSARLQIAWAGGLDGTDFQQTDLPEEVLRCTAPWEAQLHVEVDAQGQVTHALLEKGTESAALNEALVRAVRGWKASERSAPRSGKVIVRHGGTATGGPS